MPRPLLPSSAAPGPDSRTALSKALSHSAVGARGNSLVIWDSMFFQGQAGVASRTQRKAGQEACLREGPPPPGLAHRGTQPLSVTDMHACGSQAHSYAEGHTIPPSSCHLPSTPWQTRARHLSTNPSPCTQDLHLSLSFPGHQPTQDLSSGQSPQLSHAVALAGRPQLSP